MNISIINDFISTGVNTMDGYIHPLSNKLKNDLLPMLKDSILWNGEELFAYTVFGDLIAYDSEGYIIMISFLDGIKKVICANAELFFSLVKDKDYQKDYFDMDNYNYAFSHIGKLKENQCYTYEPIPALGGGKNREDIHKGSVREYIGLMIAAM